MTRLAGEGGGGGGRRRWGLTSRRGDAGGGEGGEGDEEGLRRREAADSGGGREADVDGGALAGEKAARKGEGDEGVEKATALEGEQTPGQINKLLNERLDSWDKLVAIIGFADGGDIGERYQSLVRSYSFSKTISSKNVGIGYLICAARPTPGLVSLFAKTGTARRKGRVTSVSLSPSSFRSYAVVARSAMDRNHRQGFGAGGNGGNGGFARGFHLGFGVGNQHGGAPGGRGRGRGRGRPTGRPGPRHEFSHGGGWNNFGGGHGWSSGFGLNAGPTSGGFNGVGFPAPFGSVACPDGGGVSAGKFGVAPGPSAFPAASGGVFPVGSLPTGGVPSGGLQMDGGGLPSGGLSAVMPTAGGAHAGGASGGELKAAFHMPVVVPGSGLAGDGSSGLVSVSGIVSSSGVLGASSAAAAGQVSSLKIAESGKGIAQHNWQKVDGGGSQARGSGAMVSNTSSGPTARSSAGGFVPSGGVFGTELTVWMDQIPEHAMFEG
uniref:Uncharacterized protein n=1 Tax=Oryza glumipatula TaxID=40148 RepID=A0A0D9ZH79_9ORYZ